jgi:hypothetical protein
LERKQKNCGQKKGTRAGWTRALASAEAGKTGWTRIPNWLDRLDPHPEPA